MIIRIKTQLLILIALILSFPGKVILQDEPLLEKLNNTFKKDYLSIVLLFQAVGDFQIERNIPGYNGFTIANMRINIYGELDEGFGYLFKTNLTNSPSILDAKMYYSVSPAFTMDIGLYKSPFSKEFLTSAGNIDFVNRSQIVSTLAPNRQIGFQVRGLMVENIVSYAAGIFNGNRFVNSGNDNNEFLYAGRISIFPNLTGKKEKGGKLEIGINAAHSRDSYVQIGDLLPFFNGKRTLFGTDMRLMYNKWLIAGEVIYASLETSSDTTYHPSGYYVTAGYLIAKNSQILIRWDSFSPDNITSNSHLVIFGYNLWPTGATELQINYIIQTKNSALKYNQLLVNAQFAF
jgi:phosphate-selective porin